MKICRRCGETWSEKRPPGFREECARCGEPLHACVNCRFYDADAASWCREPMARDARPRDPAVANVCDFFVFAEDDGKGTRPSAAKPKTPEKDLPAWMRTEPKEKGAGPSGLDDLFKA